MIINKIIIYFRIDIIHLNPIARSSKCSFFQKCLSLCSIYSANLDGMIIYYWVDFDGGAGEGTDQEGQEGEGEYVGDSHHNFHFVSLWALVNPGGFVIWGGDSSSRCARSE